MALAIEVLNKALLLVDLADTLCDIEFRASEGSQQKCALFHRSNPAKPCSAISDLKCILVDVHQWRPVSQAIILQAGNPRTTVEQVMLKVILELVDYVLPTVVVGGDELPNLSGL
jgi:hypothetical protein